MGGRDRDHPTRGARLAAWLPVALVLAVLAAAGLVLWLDPPAAPPEEEPAAVPPPAGLTVQPLVAPDPVAEPASGVPDPGKVRRALAPLLRDADLGPHVLATVAGLDGTLLYSSGTGSATPASTLKLLTAAAALETLGPDHTFATTVVDAGPRRVVLVGGGDPLLDRKDVTGLARDTATALAATGRTRVRVDYDTGLFRGPEVSPHWPAGYLPDGVVAPITPLWVDEGRPEDGFGRVADPAAVAAAAYAKALARAGVTVLGPQREAAAPADVAELARTDSLPLDRAAVLRFDYKLPAETKIDLYLTANGKQYSIPLTGNTEDTPLIPVLLNAGGLTADGQWHTARLPLGAALRQTFAKTAVALTDLRFGNKHQGYLLAGFGGNPTGAWYALDNFAIVPEVGAGVALAPVIKVLPRAGVAPPAIKTVRAVLDRSPQTVPSDDSVGANPPTPAESGVYYLHAQATLEDGTVTPPAHLPLLVVTTPQPLKPLDDNAAWDGGPLNFAFGDSAPTDASLTIGDK
ncbi:MAG: D-alanyl-D-alanine carboxypeptidase, partial [Nocardioides sp.]|nr:D-alanyl-D-alanine carboxypeptidase [Nocardioides sp.]